MITKQAELSYMRALGQRIRQIREQRRLTQAEVSIASGVATDMISRLENGLYVSPGLRTLFRLAKGLNMSVDALLPKDLTTTDEG